MGKKELIMVGLYFEASDPGEPFLPRLADSRGKRSPEHKTEVVAYLRDAPMMAYAMGPGRDCFDPTVLVTINCVTDGIYAWGAELAHYVERHDVFLAPAFEAHMKAKKYRLPKDLDKSKIMLPSYEPPTVDDLAAFAADLVAAGRIDEAAAAYRHLLEAAPAHEASVSALVTLYRAQDRLDESIAVLGAAIMRTPANPELWFARGTATAARAKQLAALRDGIDASARAQHAIEDLERAASLGHAEAAKVLRTTYGLEPPKPGPRKRYEKADFRYMLNNEDRGLIEALFENETGLHLGAPLVVCKDRPAYVHHGVVRPMPRGAHFYKQWFELEDTGASGWAVIFDIEPSFAVLAGWVRPEREAEVSRWVAVLNEAITRNAPAAGTIDPDQHARRSIAAFRALGIPIPQADTMDELVSKLKAASEADAPLTADELSRK